MESTVKSLHQFHYSLHTRNGPSKYSLYPHPQFTHLHFNTFPLRARFSNFPQRSDDFRSWSRQRDSLFTGDYRYEDEDEYDDDDDDDDEEEDRSLDLLVRFAQSIFKKLSRKARKAVRSVLPVSVSTQLVAFSVNGFLILTFLWLLKAVLEVFCTLGSVLFATILLIRGVWTGLSYLQNNLNLKTDDDDRHAWSGARPVS